MKPSSKGHKAAELASAILTHPNLRPSEIARAQGVKRQAVSAIGVRIGVKHRAGRPPTEDLTPRSARSKRLIAALGMLAEIWKMAPEDVLLGAAYDRASDSELVERLRSMLRGPTTTS